MTQELTVHARWSSIAALVVIVIVASACESDRRDDRAPADASTEDGATSDGGVDVRCPSWVPSMGEACAGTFSCTYERCCKPPDGPGWPEPGCSALPWAPTWSCDGTAFSRSGGRACAPWPSRVAIDGGRPVSDYADAGDSGHAPDVDGSTSDASRSFVVDAAD